jgi:hypothetical protein
MGEPTLDETDQAILRAVRDGPSDEDALAAALDLPEADVRSRLADLADNALVEESGGEYDLTENGVRLLEAPADGSEDDRIDTPHGVEAALQSLDLGPERTDAVRTTFAFLRYWGEATTAELVDAGYTEYPLGCDDPVAWWDDLVRDALADLPTVAPPGGDDRWRYESAPAVAEDDADGRDAPTAGGAGPPGSARHAVESADLDDEERAAARAAFAAVFDRGRASETEAADAVFDEHPAGYRDPAAWWDGFLRETFEAVPSLERAGDEWQYVDR